MNIFATTGTLATDAQTITWNGENFTFTGNKGASTTAIRTSDSDHFRVYVGSTFTIAGNGSAKISKIVITSVSNYVPAFDAQDGVTYETNGTTVTIKIATPVDSITLSAPKQWRLSSLEVTYLSTPPCEHEGGEATCTERATCTKCGKAYGETAEHAWGDPVVVDATCTEAGSSTKTCSVCGETETTTIPATGHNFGTDGACTNDDCDAKETTGGESASKELAKFEFGADGSATHSDGSDASTYSETVNGYTLSITNGTKTYKNARDAKGNSALKLGTGSAAGSFKFTAPAGVNKVVIYIAGYKANTAKVSINGGTTQTISTLSNNGAYTAIEIDTSSTKEVSFKTLSGGYRCMINSIVFFS